MDARYEILRCIDATEADLADIIALDRLCFGTRYEVTPEHDRDLVCVNRECSFFVRERSSGAVVAYLIALAVREDVYEELKNGRLGDDSLTGDMLVALDHPGEFRIHVSDIVIHPSYRGVHLMRVLLDRMFEDFIDLSKRGIWIKSILAELIEPDGGRLMKIIGMSEVCRTDRDSGICEVSCIPPHLRPFVPAARRFAAIAAAKSSAR